MRPFQACLAVLLAVVIAACQSPSGGDSGNDQAVWGTGVTAGGTTASFGAVAHDASGNTYSVGYITGTTAYSFGNSVSVAATSTNTNAVIVKYNTSGVAQWAATVLGTGRSAFLGVSLDGDGNVFVVGETDGTGSFDFGNAVTTTGTGSTNVLIVKYNPAGTAQWARTLTDGTFVAGFSAVAVDSSGNAYAAGSILATEAYGFGNSVTATAPSASGGVLLVKYDAAGTAQWARTNTAASNFAAYNAVAVDGSGNLYVTGKINGSDVFEFGNGVSAQGSSTGYNFLLTKYDSTGTPQWARTVGSGSGETSFNGVAVSGTNAVYAVGEARGTGTHNLGSSTQFAGSSENYNVLVVKYNAAGTVQYARTQTSGTGYSRFTAVAAAADGSVFAAGLTSGTTTVGFGNSVTVGIENEYTNYPLLTKYDASGTPQWAQTLGNHSGTAEYHGVTVDGASVYVAGLMSGIIELSSSVSVSSVTSTSTLLAKYRAD